MKFSLKWHDLFKSLILAVGTPVLYLLQEMIPHWNISALLKVAISALVTYLIKNFFTDDIKYAKKVLEKNNLLEEGPGGGTNPPVEDRPIKP